LVCFFFAIAVIFKVSINLEKLEWIVEDIAVKFSILPFYF